MTVLAGALRASTTQLQWFVAAYTLVLAAALLPGGLLGDRYGHKKMLLISLAIFGAGSVACADAGSAGPDWRVIEIRALQALALAASGDQPAAVAALAEGLSLAWPQGYVRVFADEGAPMGALLGRLIAAQRRDRTVARGVPLEYLGRLARAFGRDATHAVAPGASAAGGGGAVVPGLVEALSERELEVLRLLAAGKQNHQIAEELYVALDTVKKHLTRDDLCGAEAGCMVKQDHDVWTRAVRYLALAALAVVCPRPCVAALRVGRPRAACSWSGCTANRRGLVGGRPGRAGGWGHGRIAWCLDRARWGASGALYPQSAPAGLNPCPRVRVRRSAPGTGC